MKHINVLAALTAAAIGCGGSGSSSATSRNNPGTGSSTLLVTADIAAALSTGTPQTTFTVTVKDGAGANVSGATVAIGNSSLSGGALTLTETGTGTGRYTGTVAAFPSGDFALSVTRNTDTVLGVVVGGPGMHTINAPALNSTVTANQPLAVSWTTPTQAKQVVLTTRDMAFTGPDVGAYTIEATSNPPRTGQRVILVRSNEVDAAGGLLGSRLRATYTASVDPFTVQ
jgi:hypothetical protein